MNRPMISAQQNPAEWELPAGQARRLAPAAVQRVLRVVDGRVWLTRSGQLSDCWLVPGERAALAAGEEVVVEGWPSARFELLQSAPDLSRAPARAASSGAKAARSGSAAGAQPCAA